MAREGVCQIALVIKKNTPLCVQLVVRTDKAYATHKKFSIDWLFFFFQLSLCTTFTTWQTRLTNGPPLRVMLHHSRVCMRRSSIPENRAEEGEGLRRWRRWKTFDSHCLKRTHGHMAHVWNTIFESQMPGKGTVFWQAADIHAGTMLCGPYDQEACCSLTYIVFVSFIAMKSISSHVHKQTIHCGLLCTGGEGGRVDGCKWLGSLHTQLALR